MASPAAVLAPDPSAERQRELDVLFAIMPFADAGRPSMGVSLLEAETHAAGFSATSIYFNLDFAEHVGLGRYQSIASGFPPDLLLGERLFAEDLFGPDLPPLDDYFADIASPSAGVDPAFAEALRAAVRQVPDYLDRCAREILERAPTVVGFSTVFHQSCACLGVARRLARAPRPPLIVFGGANCEGPMGLQILESFPFIDFVCSGEADLSFPALLGRLCSGQRTDIRIPGVLVQGESTTPAESSPVEEMDALPLPTFEGYFERLERCSFDGQFDRHLVFETSRGCWWGAKHHCTFCGLNGDTMAFRSKSPERAFEEIVTLLDRYEARHIGCVDNILDMRYVRTLFPRLAERGLDLDLFYEVKANLRRDQLTAMRAGGVTQIQPGIESFSDAVLTLMDKGCTGLQNIQLMRWCRELGIEVSWNILGGFPGEDAAEYDRMAELLPRLTHLDPPCSCSVVRLDRFSPFHARAEAAGFHRVRPARAYFHVFPFGRRTLERLAYFFDFDYADGRRPDDYLTALQSAARAWTCAHAAPDADAPRLDADVNDECVSIFDTRDGTPTEHVLEGPDARLYERCDTIATRAGLARELGESEARVEARLAALDERRLVTRNNERVLSLAVFRTRRPMQDHPSGESVTLCPPSIIPVYPVAS